MTAYTVTGLRVVRLEPALLGGWWLGFASADTGVFIEAVAVVKALPYDERRFDADERAW